MMNFDASAPSPHLGFMNMKAAMPIRTETPRWAEEVLAFWYDELKPEDWFSGAEHVDSACAARFGALHEKLSAGMPDGALTSPDAALAAVLVLDQFSRNLHRGTAKAFAADDLALTIARNALELDFDAGMPNERKQFFYMPFEHSENLADQERAVSLFKGLGDPEGLKWAVDHRDIIARFGRFPHRNKALERASTADEINFMKGHAGFGQ